MASSKRPSADDNRETKRTRPFTQLVSSDIGCLYLINTAKYEGDATVYKFGRSTKIEDRFEEYYPSYGEGALLDTVILVPVEKLSKAETRLHKSIVEEACFSYDKENEEIMLDSADRTALRAVMQTIADKYRGSVLIQASVHQSEMKDQAFKYELRIKDLERMVEVLEGRTQHAVAEEKRNAAELLHQLAMKDIQLDNQLKNDEMRLKVIKLEHDAQLAEKDRRIEELEETNRRLQKSTP